MTDPGDDEQIESRLRADAAFSRAHESAPSFEPMLDRSLTARRHHSRRSVVTWLSAAAIVVLGGGLAVGAAVTGGYGLSGTQAATGGSLRTMTDVGFSGAVLDPSDPRKLEVLVSTGTAGTPCDLIAPTARVVDETPSAVTVGVSGQFHPPSNAPATGYFGYSCEHIGYRQVPVTLSAPLGSRTLFSVGDKTPQPVLDPRTVPTPSFVPAGYTPGAVTWEPDSPLPRRYATYSATGTSGGTGAPGSQDSAEPSPSIGDTHSLTGTPGLPTSGDSPGAGVRWPAIRSYRRGDVLLIVRVGGGLDGPGKTLGHASISGHEATITDDGGGLCVTWQLTADSGGTPAPSTAVTASPTAEPPTSATATEPSGWRSVQVCSGVAPGPSADPTTSANRGWSAYTPSSDSAAHPTESSEPVPTLNQQTLLRVARSLRY